MKKVILALAMCLMLVGVEARAHTERSGHICGKKLSPGFSTDGALERSEENTRAKFFDGARKERERYSQRIEGPEIEPQRIAGWLRLTRHPTSKLALGSFSVFGNCCREPARRPPRPNATAQPSHVSDGEARIHRRSRRSLWKR